MSVRPYLEVQVSAGCFSDEKYIEFRADKQNYGLFVWQQDSRRVGNKLYVLAEQNDDGNLVVDNDNRVLIQLPNDTWITGNRIKVPYELLKWEEC